MKVLALGGSGGMGRYAVQYLHNIKQIEKIYVADVNSLLAKKFASHFDNRVEGLKLDIRDFETLKSEMSKVDIVVNTTGPFFLFAEPILKAAIQTNTHYFDICDDWEPTEKMLQMNEDAKKNKIKEDVIRKQKESFEEAEKAKRDIQENRLNVMQEQRYHD